MAEDGIVYTWATRELPILRAALKRSDAGDMFPSPEGIRAEVGLDVMQMHVALGALGALEEAGYLEISRTMAGPQKVGGHVDRVTERTRRELGSWPSPEGVVEQLALALSEEAEAEQEPAQRARLRTAVDVLTGTGKQIMVDVLARVLESKF